MTFDLRGGNRSCRGAALFVPFRQHPDHHVGLAVDCFLSVTHYDGVVRHDLGNALRIMTRQNAGRAQFDIETRISAHAVGRVRKLDLPQQRTGERVSNTRRAIDQVSVAMG